MSNIFKLESISILNSLFQQAAPRHPMVNIIDFSKVNFDNLEIVSEQKVSTSFYGVLSKQLKSGSLKYGRGHCDFQEGSLFFFAPNQVATLENPEIDECTYNWGIFFHPDLIKGTPLFNKITQFTFFNYQSDEALHLSEEEKQGLAEVLTSIKKEIDRPIDKHTKAVLVSGIELLLNHCMRYYDRQFITRAEPNKNTITQLEDYLNTYFSSGLPQQMGLPTVKQCAEKVNLSPNYLSDLLKKETGKSTQDHIHYHVLEEAKNLLLSSDNSVSQIAYSLGFEYPQYFSKIFKKKIGVSPLEYRNFN